MPKTPSVTKKNVKPEDSQTRVESITALNPLLKWPGGKRWLVKDLVPHLDNGEGRYYEPFLGGAAVFLSLLPRAATLSDTNSELINAYTQVRDEPDRLVGLLKKFRNTAKCYYEVRGSSPKGGLARAARLLYLMRLSFNGIHRVNLKGEFNVPYGRKGHLTVCDEDHVFQLSRALQRAKLLVADFEVATRSAHEGDTAYFDPPYTVAHGNNGFVKYNEKIFSWDDQKRLADHARELAKRGVRVIVSNADHDSIRGLYRGFSIRTVSRFSRIAAESRHRKEITELLLSLGGAK